MISLVVGLAAIAVSWSFLFWCVYWTCTSDMHGFLKALVVVFCIFAFFSIQFEFKDDGKNNISFGKTKEKQEQRK